ncbi:MAG: DUF1847 domain-containing protein [Candidatus Bathyarchaeia archaeon]
MVSLCVGHDMLFTKFSKAPVTTLIVRAPMENAQGKHCRCKAAAKHHSCKPNKALRSNLLNFLTERQRLSPL